MLTNIICSNGNDSIDLCGDDVVIVDIQGVSPSEIVNTAKSHSMDGGIVQSMSCDVRNITFVLQFISDVESKKALLYKVFAMKKQGQMIYKLSSQTFYIDYYVEKIEVPPMKYPLIAQISLICVDPYFKTNEKVIPMQGITPMWKFPWEIPESGFEFAVQSPDRIARINNDGEVETGCIFELNAIAYVKNPKLQNINTFEWIELNFEMQADDVIVINTIKGQKSITLKRNGITTNIINYKVWGSTFLQLVCGLNEIVCDAQSGLNSLTISCHVAERYGGV